MHKRRERAGLREGATGGAPPAPPRARPRSGFPEPAAPPTWNEWTRRPQCPRIKQGLGCKSPKRGVCAETAEPVVLEQLRPRWPWGSASVPPAPSVQPEGGPQITAGVGCRPQIIAREGCPPRPWWGRGDVSRPSRGRGAAPRPQRGPGADQRPRRGRGGMQLGSQRAPSRYPSRAPSPRTPSRRCPCTLAACSRGQRPASPALQLCPPGAWPSLALPCPPWPCPWPSLALPALPLPALPVPGPVPASLPSPGPRPLLAATAGTAPQPLGLSSLFPPEHLWAGLGVLTSCSAPASSPQEWSVACCLVGLTH